MLFCALVTDRPTAARILVKAPVRSGWTASNVMGMNQASASAVISHGALTIVDIRRMQGSTVTVQTVILS
ncbi:hypothetical protein DPMN_115557 [Dreissena polymorpha]|uniref:Uncharacterized protein n=1 Tax=Dreissena polymorpha TaxID=45954 RepID=A0A9D4QSR1_DREPO|nr:hypothetical protein DPMN_115557 [Dreissena polymorpha]